MYGEARHSSLAKDCRLKGGVPLSAVVVASMLATVAIWRIYHAVPTSLINAFRPLYLHNVGREHQKGRRGTLDLQRLSIRGWYWKEEQEEEEVGRLVTLQWPVQHFLFFMRANKN